MNSIVAGRMLHPANILQASAARNREIINSHKQHQRNETNQQWLSDYWLYAAQHLMNCIDSLTPTLATLHC